MDDGIADENDVRLDGFIAREDFGVALLPVVRGVIPILGDGRGGDQTILTDGCGGATAEQQSRQCQGKQNSFHAASVPKSAKLPIRE